MAATAHAYEGLMKSNAGGSVFKPAFMLMSGRALGFVAAFAIPIVLVRMFDQTDFAHLQAAVPDLHDSLSHRPDGPRREPVLLPAWGAPGRRLLRGQRDDGIDVSRGPYVWSVCGC